MKYYYSYKVRLVYFFIFTAVTLVQIFIFRIQTPSLYSFLFNLAIGPLFFFTLYFFLKSLFVPRLQLNKTEIVFSNFFKKAILIQDVRELSLNKNLVFISYVEDEKVKKVSLSIQQNDLDQSVYILNGKFHRVQ